MEALTPGQSKPLLLKYIQPYFEGKGFILKKNSGAQSFFYRKTGLGRDENMFTAENYYPVVYYIYHFSKKSKALRGIIKEMCRKNQSLGSQLCSDDLYMACAPEADDKLSFRRMPECRNEAEIKVNAEMIIDYSERFALPLLDRFEDIRQLDKEINSGTPWLTDYPPRNHFNGQFTLGGNFHMKRLIVGRLAGRDMASLYGIYEYMIQEWEKEANEEWAWSKEGYIEAQKEMEYALEFLKDVEPLKFDK